MQMERGCPIEDFDVVDIESVLGPGLVCISVVLEAAHEASRGPEKGAVSAQKALRGSETEPRELLGGTTEN